MQNLPAAQGPLGDQDLLAAQDLLATQDQLVIPSWCVSDFAKFLGPLPLENLAALRWSYTTENDWKKEFF